MEIIVGIVIGMFGVSLSCWHCLQNGCCDTLGETWSIHGCAIHEREQFFASIIVHIDINVYWDMYEDILQYEKGGTVPKWSHHT